MENIDMKQRTWFITGVNSGFGRIMTEKLLERGDRVAGTARKLGELDDLKKQYSDLFWLTSLDLTDTPAIREVVKGAFSHFGRVDVIVNNAGTSATSPGQRRHDRVHKALTERLAALEAQRDIAMSTDATA
jgi:NADP-dependent 3-hydroxy acid dehydrogenase YdfG